MNEEKPKGTPESQAFNAGLRSAFDLLITAILLTLAIVFAPIVVTIPIFGTLAEAGLLIGMMLAFYRGLTGLVDGIRKYYTEEQFLYLWGHDQSGKSVAYGRKVFAGLSLSLVVVGILSLLTGSQDPINVVTDATFTTLSVIAFLWIRTGGYDRWAARDRENILRIWARWHPETES